MGVVDSYSLRPGRIITGRRNDVQVSPNNNKHDDSRSEPIFEPWLIFDIRARTGKPDKAPLPPSPPRLSPFSLAARSDLTTESTYHRSRGMISTSAATTFVKSEMGFALWVRPQIVNPTCLHVAPAPVRFSVAQNMNAVIRAQALTSLPPARPWMEVAR